MAQLKASLAQTEDSLKIALAEAESIREVAASRKALADTLSKAKQELENDLSGVRCMEYLNEYLASSCQCCGWYMTRLSTLVYTVLYFGGSHRPGRACPSTD